MHFDNIAEKAVEQLYEDESLRSNLTDDQAAKVAEWTAKWARGRLDAAADEPDARQIMKLALAQVRPVIKGVNAFAARGGKWNVSEVLAALEPVLKSNKELPPTQVAELIAALASEQDRV